jgi:hypothetical protein
VDRDARAALSLIREAVKDCALLGWVPPLSDPRLAELRHKTQQSGVGEVSIIDALGRICGLQPSYTSTNTPEMQERGRLIRLRRLRFFGQWDKLRADRSKRI